jgi:hypothetical protein
MALFSECMQSCARKVLDSADIVRDRDVTPPARGLLRLQHVQFWETENCWRLDSSHRGGHRRHIPCLVDASDVRTVNALNPPGVVNERYWDLTSTTSQVPSLQVADNPTVISFSLARIVVTRGECRQPRWRRDSLPLHPNLYKSPRRRRLRKVIATARAPRAINTPAQVIHAGYSCWGGANDAVRKKNGFTYIVTRMFSGISYQPRSVG